MRDEYEFEQHLITKPPLPQGPHRSLLGKRQNMSNQQLDDYAQYLHRVFCSIGCMTNERVYRILRIHDPDIKTLFQSLAVSSFQRLKDRADSDQWKKPMRTPLRLSGKRGIEFHTLWVGKRPLNNIAAKKIGLDHWAIKLEGMSVCDLCFLRETTVYHRTLTQGMAI